MRIMSDGDIFREVEQELRKERLASLWERYGLYILSAAGAIVLSVGGYQTWTWWQAARASQDGAMFLETSRLGDDAVETAESRFRDLSENGTAGYAVLARLRVAAIEAAKGNRDEAVRAYDLAASSAASDVLLSGFARIQSASLLVDTAGREEITRRLDGMTSASHPWRHSARELLALAAYRANDQAEAQRLYEELLRDPDAPAPMRQRAQMMLSLLVAPAALAESRPAPDETTSPEPAQSN
jgi:hypothetical protein